MHFPIDIVRGYCVAFSVSPGIIETAATCNRVIPSKGSFPERCDRTRKRRKWGSPRKRRFIAWFLPGNSVLNGHLSVVYDAGFVREPMILADVKTDIRVFTLKR
jgi:hypothetical protein